MSSIIFEFIQYFFLQMVLNRITGILKLFSSSNLSNSIPRFSLQHSKIPATLDSKLSRRHLSFSEKPAVHDDGLRGDELELLMANLGGFGEGDRLPEVVNSADILNVFEEEEPRLDEVKGAFDVFDVNRDGFIDAGELGRVIRVLGLKEGTDVEECRKMIGMVDENHDGRIDFSEFLKFMENTFC